MGGNPKDVYGERNQRPMTRMGIAQVIMDTFDQARDYGKKKVAAGGDPEKMPPFDRAMENVLRVLNREIPVKVHCEQFDMLTVIRIAEKYDIKFTLDHAWGASDFYDEICSSKNLVGVIFGPIGVKLLPGEIGKVDIDCLKELDRRGICCSIMTDGPIMNPDAIVIQAGEAVRFGLDPLRAIDMLTINPAKILGVDDRVGSLAPGKDADVLLWSSQPALDVSARVVKEIAGGEVLNF